MAIETIQRLTAIPYLASPADNALAELAATMARLAHDSPGLLEAVRLVKQARRHLRAAVLLADVVAGKAIQEAATRPVKTASPTRRG